MSRLGFPWAWARLAASESRADYGVAHRPRQCAQTAMAMPFMPGARAAAIKPA